MGFRPAELELRRDGDQLFELLIPLRYAARDLIFIVPAHFRTDLASVPRVLTWLIPRYGHYTLCVILHDYLCALLAAGLCPVSARDVDGILRRSMREAGVGPVVRWTIWAGVRWGALADRHRLAGWWRDLPVLLPLTLALAPIAIPPAVLAAFSLGLFGLAESGAELVTPRA